MIEYKRVGILCNYDNEMTSYSQSSYAEKQKWYNSVEEKIRDASCVFCYLSKNYVVSQPILLELKLIEKYQKPVIAIDLEGDHRISALFMRVANNPELAARVTSDSLYWFCKKFDDDNNIITREKSPMFSNHIKQVIDRLNSLCPEAINALESDYGQRQNRGKEHPQEDYLVCDNSHNIYIVADGITRPRKEYEPNKNNNISYEISKKFCDIFAESFLNETIGLNDNELIPNKFRHAFINANKAVKEISDEYRKNCLPEKSESPGAVAIAATVYNDILYFGAIGDCVGILIRNKQKIIFSDKQTTYAFDKKGVELERDTLQEHYINKPDKPYGYGVINGDEKAVHFFNIGHLSLEYGDTIYLVSDGIADYIRYCHYDIYANKTIEEIIDATIEYEENLHGKSCPHDDMTIIRIKWVGTPNLIIEMKKETIGESTQT